MLLRSLSINHIYHHCMHYKYCNGKTNITVSQSNFHKYKTVLFKCVYCRGEGIINIIRCVFTPVEESFHKSSTNVIELDAYCTSVTILQCTFQHYQGHNGHIINIDNDCWTKAKSKLLIKSTAFRLITVVHSVIYARNINIYF